MRNLALLLCAAGLLAQPREGFVNVPGGPVWYRILGEGSGKEKGAPILAVHGGPGGTSCGFLDLAPLAEGRKLIVFDQLGSGRSGRPSDRKLWNVARFVEELHTVRQKLGLKQVHLLGHSWGGALVAEYLLRKGTKGVKSVILASPLLSTPDWIEDANELRQQLPPEVQATLKKHEAAGTTNSPEYRAAEQEFNKRFLSRRPGRGANPDCAGSAFNPVIYEQMWGPSEFHATGTLKSFDLKSELPKLKLPVLLVVGEFDEARPATAARYQKLIPNSRLEVIPNAAHALWWDNREATLRVLNDFLKPH
jgi:proline-specific peptidase